MAKRKRRPKLEHRFVKVPADPIPDGCYKGCWLRDDVAGRVLAVSDILHAAGAILTTSGGRRSLRTKVTKNRSATSLHYLGLAFDICLKSGMKDPRTDPYVVTSEQIRHDRALWRVYARCLLADDGTDPFSAGAEYRNIIGWTYHRKQLAVAGLFLDLTSLFDKLGFSPIRSRQRFIRSKRQPSVGSAEWWHFQADDLLTPGESTFGGELEKVYTAKKLAAAPSGIKRAMALTWNGRTFA